MFLHTHTHTQNRGKVVSSYDLRTVYSLDNVYVCRYWGTLLSWHFPSTFKQAWRHNRKLWLASQWVLWCHFMSDQYYLQLNSHHKFTFTNCPAYDTFCPYTHHCKKKMKKKQTMKKKNKKNRKKMIKWKKRRKRNRRRWRRSNSSRRKLDEEVAEEKETEEEDWVTTEEEQL